MFRGCDRRKECSFNKDRARIYVSDSHLLYLKADPEERKKALEKRKRMVKLLKTKKAVAKLVFSSGKMSQRTVGFP